MAYLQNCWYVAAWAQEVDEGFLARTLLDIEVMLLRGLDGRIVALHDRCPHRFAPLSLGSFVDGKIRCGYHGLEFDLAGNCVGSCISSSAPKAARVRTFPIVEQDKIVWIWMGDPARADPETIMRFPKLTDPALRTVSGSMLAAADYRLISDNLMDLTHAALLHPVFGGLNYQPKFRSWEEGDDVISEYTSEMPSSMIVGDTPVTGVDTIRWRVPGLHDLTVSITPKDPTFKAAEFPAVHIVTPETQTTSHYFWAASIDASFPMTNEQLSASLTDAFDNEDKPMIEAVQRRMGSRDLFEMKPLLLGTDASGVRVRRKLAAMIAREQADLDQNMTEAA